MTTALAKQEPQSAIPKTVKGWLSSEHFKTQVALCLPKHLTADRFVRVAMTALVRTPKLADCTPESVVRCMMTCSELGIEPDGRRAHLIPYGNTCTLIIDYKGLVELAKRSGDVSNISANVVCENDHFEYDTGKITHKIDFKRDRGTMYAAYAIITFKDETTHCEVMTKGEIDAIRKRSKAGTNGPWVTDYNEMAKKTVFRRASKWVTLSPEIADALDRDADAPTQINALVNEAAIEFPSEPVPEKQAEKVIDLPSEATPSPKPQEPSGEQETLSLQDALAKVVLDAGHTFDTFRKWAAETGNLDDAQSIGGFGEVPSEIAKRLMRAKVGLLKGLEMTKAAAV